MFKKGFFYIAIVLMCVAGVGCSSNNDSGEDLDISEIKEIEATGEFSEDEFFSADSEGLETVEEQLVEEVQGLDDEVSEDVAGLEGDGLDEELQIDEGFEGSENVAQLEGADVFDDASDDLEEDLTGGSNVDITVSAEDLGFEEDGEAGVFDDEVAANGSSDQISDDELDLDSEDDLFREDSETIDVAENDEEVTDSFTEDIGLELDESGDSLDLAEERSASQTVGEEVTIDDLDYTDLAEDKSASQLLSEDDVSIDVDYSGSDTTALAANSESSGAKSFVPVKKMQTVPYSKNGVLVNAIYFVRAGDTLNSIGSKIYGSGSAVDFRVVNSHLKEGSLRVGQKVYYNSPNRSQDRSRLLTYYEDVRLPAQIYSASTGENIRTISKNLLGHSRSWIEVWASNQQIQEKWALEAPYQIRYWQGGVPVPTLAKNNTPAPPSTPPVQKIAPAAPTATKVARQDTASQASLNLEESEIEDEDDIFDEPVVANDGLNKPDMELETPAEVNDVAGISDDLDEDDIFDDPIEDELDEVAVSDTQDINNLAGANPAKPGGSVAAIDGRGIARNKGGFPAKSGGLFDSALVRKGLVGVSLLLLLIVGYLVVKRRRESQAAIEMESFDFGGETTIDDAQDKTQIDL